MPDPADRGPHVLMIGAFPPQAQGIPGYCGSLAAAIGRRATIRALGFRAMYPPWLFPGVKAANDPTSAAPVAPGLTVTHALAWYNPLGWLWHAWRAPADIVHIQWWSLPLFPVCLTFALAARMRGLPLVLTVHNIQPHEPSPGFTIASRILYRLADHCIVHSETNREQLCASGVVALDRVSCIPMGADDGPIAPPDRPTARATLDLPEDAEVVLFFGTIRPYKGLRDMLRAAAIARKLLPRLHLVIAGKPWEDWAPLDGLIRDLGLGDFVRARLEYVPEADLPPIFAAADLAVLPYTHFDAQSAAGSRLIAAGLPLIVTDTGGLPELVQRDPRWVAPPNDPEALAARIVAYFTDPGAAGAFREIATSTRAAMSWDGAAEAHLRLYRDLLK